ncbi:hypothetical protein BpHYR1_043454 [Brachionus plicatilis]|uniref:Uncharacterized protein n=1 Tax=Brachionus plicatilis TaxID=10195 RepID=A0A3M7RNX0_BRAPC|nr:hypothetical protein BpHYR1_043454 [Brachionus plicatilis]
MKATRLVKNLRKRVLMKGRNFKTYEHLLRKEFELTNIKKINYLMTIKYVILILDHKQVLQLILLHRVNITRYDLVRSSATISGVWQTNPLSHEYIFTIDCWI